ncbi:MAG TPA: DUF3971 domain-containing protein [Terriglobales bacterium]|nr:DUF3971 domain-containing protein [Terriglobales bacterium]
MKVLRWLIWAAVIVAVPLLILGVALVLRLRHAPIPVDVAAEKIRLALPRVSPELDWHVGGVDLAWGGWRRGIRVRARGTRLIDRSGKPVLQLPVVGVHLAIRPLLRGELTIGAVELIRPRLQLLRDAQGRLSLTVSSPKAKQQPDSGIAALEALRTVLQQQDGDLRHIVIKHGQIIITDEQLGGGWFVDRADVDLARTREGLAAAIDATMTVEHSTINLQAQASLGAPAPHVFEAAITVPELPVPALETLWPIGLSTKTRKWIVENITTGHVSRLHAELHSQLDLSDRPPKAPPRSRLERVTLQGGFEVEDISVRYLDTMPPATDIRARARIALDGLSFEVASAKLETIAIGPAHVRLDGLRRDQPRIVVDASTRGTLAETLAILDHEPLHVARSMKLDPAAAEGAMESQIKFDFSLKGPIDGKNLGLDARGKLRDVRLPDAFNSWTIDQADLEVAVDDDSVVVSGPARIAGVPLEAQWKEKLHGGGDPRREMSFAGTVSNEDRRNLGTALEWIDGPVPIEIDLTQGWDADPVIELRADLTDANVAGSFGLRKPTGDSGVLRARVRLEDDRVREIESLRFEAPETSILATAQRSESGWRSIDASGALRAAPFRFVLQPGEPSDTFALSSEDAAALVRVVGLYGEGRGGTLSIDGRVDLDDPQLAYDATVRVEDFVAGQAPTLAKILSLASFSGIQQVMTSQGIRFHQIAAAVSGNRDRIEIRDGAAAGKTLSLIIDGEADRGQNHLALNGTLAPDYYGLNRMLNRVPVLGKLLTDDGAGVMAVSFTIRGPFDKPEVKIDPLKTLTPGLLRQLGRLFEDQPPAVPGG